MQRGERRNAQGWGWRNIHGGTEKRKFYNGGHIGWDILGGTKIRDLHYGYYNKILLGSSIGPTRVDLVYSHWSTETECSTHSRSTQPPTKLCAPLYTCTNSLYVHVLHMKTCACCLQPTNKQEKLISDESILVVVFVRVTVLVSMP